ncbi:Protein Smaug -like protein 1 [Triplophysa tibetana]|uniref:Protein Smaug-like protein 1 n=1 Tax=Triplophysa tibetana TaxID=1572043 RepID=A0A5A9NLP5_9TELE|nr:Protein Smaug -like protein 1 [Triplophysa tibetana]
MMFRDQVGVLAGWFKGWNECEQTVALLSLLKRVSRTQARFLQLCLEHSLADCTELHVLEREANNPGNKRFKISSKSENVQSSMNED